MTNPRHEIFAALSETWSFFPDYWHFGKLMDNLAIWANGPDCLGIQETLDEKLLEECREQIAKRKKDRTPRPALGMYQQNALSAFESFSLSFPDISLGELLFRLATAGGKRVYDLEDEQLIVLANKESKEVLLSR